eukprot:3016507-Prymnesium_polylepis.1
MSARGVSAYRRCSGLSQKADAEGNATSWFIANAPSRRRMNGLQSFQYDGMASSLPWTSRLTCSGLPAALR